MWFVPAAPPVVAGTGTDAGGDLEGLALAAAVHLLAVSGLAASGDRPATAGSAATDAPAGVGSGARAAEVGHLGHRHHRAHALWSPDGSAERLQPAAQGEEKLPADPDLSGRDAGVREGRAAER